MWATRWFRRTLFNYHFGCCVTPYLWMKITCKESLEPSSMFNVTSTSLNQRACVRMPLVMIKKAREEVKEAPLFHAVWSFSIACSSMLRGLAPSPNHSSTEWLHTLWSQSTPISLCYKLCLHTVSADHLLVQHSLLKTEMTEHGGGRGGRLSGVVLVGTLRCLPWEQWCICTNFRTEFPHFFSLLFFFVCQI